MEIRGGEARRRGSGACARLSLIVALLAAAQLLSPAPAHARVTISIEIAYGGIVVGGVGFFVYIAGAWEIPLAERGIPTALLEVRGDGSRWGVPLIRPRAAALERRERGGEGFEVDLLRWRF